MSPLPWIAPDWPGIGGVRALVTTRAGGLSGPPWDCPSGPGLNLSFLGDDPQATHNRALLRAQLPAEPFWLRQVHGAGVVQLGATVPDGRPEADAAFTLERGVVCVVQMADCLPVLVADERGRAVGVAHAGWRGLAAGVIQELVRCMRAALGGRAEFCAWLGPAIGPGHFQVGAEVLEAMRARLPDAAGAFRPDGQGRYRADLQALAVQALAQAGAMRVRSLGDCTFAQADRYYSHRRDQGSGRHAALVWLEPALPAAMPLARQRLSL
jgi:YfiH family protein